MKKLLSRIWVLGTLFLIISSAQQLFAQNVIQSASSNCYTSGHGPDLAIDGNYGTYYEKQSNPCYLDLNITLTHSISVAKVKIKADKAGVIINAGSKQDYTRTVNTTDEFYIVYPDGFSNIELVKDQSVIRIYEVEVTEISLESASLPLLYDDAGNVYNKKLVISLVKSTSQKDEDKEPESVVLDDKEILIFPNPTEGELMLEIPTLTEEDQGLAEIVNTSGKSILVEPINHNKTLLNLSNYPAGIYFLKLKFNDQMKQFTIVKN